MPSKVAFLSALLFFLIGPTLIPGAGVDVGWAQKKKVSVVGVVTEVKDKTWRDHRIGFGIANLISQELFKSGRFTVVEEKKEVLEQISEFTRRNWTNPENTPRGEKALSLARKLEVDLVAVGRVISYSHGRSRLAIGLFVKGQQKIVVNVEVGIIGKSLPKTLLAQGEGSSKFTSQGLVFELRKDVVLFDETTVGRATKAAVREAINRLLELLPPSI